jgi:hypothetical protein
LRKERVAEERDDTGGRVIWIDASIGLGREEEGVSKFDG